MGAALWALRRFVVAVLTVLAVAILIFASVRLMPGSYIDVALGPLATAEQRAAAMSEAGLDQPVVVQFVQWIGGIVTGDLGRSFVSDRRHRRRVRAAPARNGDRRARSDRAHGAGRDSARVHHGAERGIPRRRGWRTHRERNWYQPARVCARRPRRIRRLRHYRSACPSAGTALSARIREHSSDPSSCRRSSLPCRAPRSPRATPAMR